MLQDQNYGFASTDLYIDTQSTMSSIQNHATKWYC